MQKNFKASEIFVLDQMSMQVEEHSHNLSQLSMPVDGTLYMIIDNHLFVIPLGSAIYIPSGKLHAVYNPAKKLIVRSIYLPAKYLLSEYEMVVNLSGLAYAVFEKICLINDNELNGKRWDNLIHVLLDEIGESFTTPFAIPLTNHPILKKIASIFHKSSNKYPSLTEVATAVGVSVRTLIRLFNSELGMGFAKWKQKFLFVRALGLLQDYKGTKEIAYMLGYNSESAFIHMFRKMSGGMTPSNYMKLLKKQI